MTAHIENELRHFNRVVDTLRAAMTAGDTATAREMFDEIETVALHTESAELRAMCKPYMLPN